MTVERPWRGTLRLGLLSVQDTPITRRVSGHFSAQLVGSKDLHLDVRMDAGIVQLLAHLK